MVNGICSCPASSIIRTLLEREWVQVVGHKEVPGRPALFATTRQFLDYFNLTSLNDLPPLQAFLEQLDPLIQNELSEIEPPSNDHVESEKTPDSAQESTA